MNSFPHSIDIIPGVLLFSVSKEMNADITHRIAAFVDDIDRIQDGSILEIVPSYASVMVIYDDSVTSRNETVPLLLDTWKRTLQAVGERRSNTISVDVVYGDTFGEDIANVSEFTGVPVDEVITLHVSGSYTVGAVGFSPGFTYLIGMPPELTTPRRDRPRLRVPAGSVGIGGNQTGVYALESAGGWNLIGRSPTRLFDPMASPPVQLRLGDVVRFRAVDSADFSELDRAHSQPEGDGPIQVVSPGLQTTIQDLGRYGMGRYGFATDGAADRASLVEANRLVGNSNNTSCLECTHQGPTLRFDRRMVFAIAGADIGARLNGRPIRAGSRFETMPGDELDFVAGPTTHGSRTYLAVKDGFDVPLVMGSASTNLTAKIGGWHGRALVRGDRLSTGQQQFPEAAIVPGLQLRTAVGSSDPFRVKPGPQRDRFDEATWRRLLNSEFGVSDDANRVGIRLLGPSLAPTNGADSLSEGIVTGSIQVTGEGQAIVMLPGHATIGGYTKIATVIAEDWDRLGQVSPGDSVRFALAD